MSDSLELTYGLFTLPTAQHRAGLAGLVLQIDTMRRRRLSPIPDVRFKAPDTVTVALTRESLTAVLNDVYDAATEEVSQPALRKNRDGETILPIRIEETKAADPRTGKERTLTRYVYPQVTPRGQVLRSLEMPDPWLKLWRDTIWQTLRGIPRTRLPYEQRAAGKDVEEAGRLWHELERGDRQDAYMTEVASSLFLGAQAHNAENVPFAGRPKENLLLHFWPLVMGLGEAWRLEVGKSGIEEKVAGFVVSVPNVADLEEFVRLYPGVVSALSAEMVRYRPRDAVLALPAEGALQFLRYLALLARGRSARGELAFAVAGVEAYHLEKRGNSIVLLATDTVPARVELIDRYEAIRSSTRDILFRAQLIRNLLDGQDWYAGFDRLLDTADRRLILGSTAYRFAADVRRRLADELHETT